jgi:hypothetical protein
MVVFIYSPPLSPSQTGLFSGVYFIMFERGKEYERGLRPLSTQLPSPAINTRGLLTMISAGEGIKR